MDRRPNNRIIAQAMAWVAGLTVNRSNTGYTDEMISEMAYQYMGLRFDGESHSVACEIAVKLAAIAFKNIPPPDALNIPEPTYASAPQGTALPWKWSTDPGWSSSSAPYRVYDARFRTVAFVNTKEEAEFICAAANRSQGS